MKITVVTLYDGNMEERWVGAVEGSLTQEQRDKLKVAYDATLEDPGEYEEGRYLTFAEVETVKEPSDLRELLNLDDTPSSAASVKLT